MKSKRTVVLVITAALMLSSNQVFAKDENNTANNNKPVYVTADLNAENKGIAPETKDKLNIPQDEAKELGKKAVKDYFQLEIDDKLFQCNSNFRDQYLGGVKKMVWDIHWYNPNADRQVNIDVAMDGKTGKIIRVSKSEFDPKENKVGIANITKEQAKEVAETFLKKINPENFKETTAAKDDPDNFYGGNTYVFNYNRIINKVPFSNNNISVRVDGVTGKAVSYEINWDENIKAPTSDKVMDEKLAEDIYNKNTKMELNYTTYISKTMDDTENKTKLVYSPDSSSPIIIDAENGKALNWNGQSLQSVKTRNITDNQKEDILKNAKELPKFSTPINSQRAEQVLKDTLKSLYGDIYIIQSISYEESGHGPMVSGIKSWSCTFEKKDKGNNFGPPEGHIAINALTEELIALNKFNFNDIENEKFQPKLNWEQAYDKAIQFMAKNCPERIKDINTEQKDNNKGMYMNEEDRYKVFNFKRIINGVPFNGINYNNGINIAFDCKTGELTNFSCMWQDKLEVPPVVKVVSNEEAKNTFLNANKPQLIYLLPNNEKNKENSNLEMKLVYSIGNINIPAVTNLNSVDAVTGKVLNFLGENVEDNMEAFKSKIKGSSVEKEASILASQGIIDIKDFKLDGEITRLQLIKTLVNVKGFNPYLKGMEELNFTGGAGSKDSKDYKYLQFAVKYGIIQDGKEEFKGNELVTREEMAKSLVKLTGYEKIAETKGILNLVYSDANSISDDKKGYVSLAGGLKFIEVNSEGKIRPKDNVTMVELIKAVYISLK